MDDLMWGNQTPAPDMWGSGDLVSDALAELAGQFEDSLKEEEELPADWMEKHYLVPAPRDPITGEILPAGPIRFTDHQKRIINEALSKNEKGNLRYVTVLFSAPKKSGKSAIASGVGLYMARKIPYAQIYCLANDGKSSRDRLYGPMFRCLMMHKQRGLDLKDTKVNLTEAYFENFAHVEAIPCDASGEAGSEPTATLWSEFWGFDSEAKHRLFTEMTVPPTLYGRSIRWIESYAGFIGVSNLLWDMYHLGVKQGTPHPDFLDLRGRDGEPVVYVNETAKMFTYWDTVPRMPWQTDEYYQQEASILDDSEFQRIHRNQWVSDKGTFVDGSQWDACQNKLIPPLPIGSDVPVVLGVDAAVSGDCAAIVAITRDPFLPETDTAVRYCKIIKPSPGKAINIEKDIGGEIRKLSKWWNIVCVAYDAYQMESTAQSYRRGAVAIAPDELENMSPKEAEAYLEQESRAAQLWYYKFGQQAPRGVADKRLYDMIINRQIHWNPDDRDSDIAPQGDRETLTKHIKQAGAKNDGKQRRIEKLAEDSHVDGSVAASMANDRCMELNLDNRELFADNIMRQLQKGDITYEEFQKRMDMARLRARMKDE